MKKNSLQQYIKSFLDIKKNQKIKNLIMIKKEHFSRQWNSFTLAKTDNFRQFGGRILFSLQLLQTTTTFRDWRKFAIFGQPLKAVVREAGQKEQILGVKFKSCRTLLSFPL